MLSGILTRPCDQLQGGSRRSWGAKLASVYSHGPGRDSTAVG